jgi:threonine/homoserine/homoserine lactone efflux protein
VLNPKMALFTVALLPQFVDPSRGQVPAQFLVLGACFVAIEIMVDGTVGLAAGRLRRVLVGRPRAARGLDLASGSVFVGLAAKLALTR